MELRSVKRMVSVSVLTGALVLGVWGGTGGAAPRTPPHYSVSVMPNHDEGHRTLVLDSLHPESACQRFVESARLKDP